MSTVNSRAWMRLTPEEKRVQLKSVEGITTAEVVDVSFGGVALACDRNVHLSEGDPVDINWRGSWMRGCVRHLLEEKNGVRLGIEWAKSTSAAK